MCIPKISNMHVAPGWASGTDTDGEQFAKHEAAEEAEREEAEREKATVNLKNVPLKFRRQQGRR